MTFTREHNPGLEEAQTDLEAEAGAHAANPLDNAKARQILDGARTIFLAEGFDAASMNDIAREAGVSKGTIYSYFPSKDALFTALIREDKRQQAEQLSIYDDPDGPIDEVLPRIGFALMDVILEPAHVAQTRTIAAVAPRFPEIGRAFYEAGPEYGHRRFADFLERRAARGELVIENFELAAEQFFNLAQGVLFKKMLFTAQPKPPRAEIQATVDAAARVFLKSYGAR
ncbi:MAG TPA: TetR/AcrR family transcriptional regulator [Rhodoblastus sp.]|nr:TetR/AcrR family transcriptional regulator [Rhodoblastus sp.]